MLRAGFRLNVSHRASEQYILSCYEILSLCPRADCKRTKPSCLSVQGAGCAGAGGAWRLLENAELHRAGTRSCLTSNANAPLKQDRRISAPTAISGCWFRTPTSHPSSSCAAPNFFQVTAAAVLCTKVKALDCCF